MDSLSYTLISRECYTLYELFVKTADTYLLIKLLILIIGIFYPTGADPTYQLISLQSLHCSPLAVVHYSFMGHCLDFAAISTRE